MAMGKSQYIGVWHTEERSLAVYSTRFGLRDFGSTVVYCCIQKLSRVTELSLTIVVKRPTSCTREVTKVNGFSLL